MLKPEYTDHVARNTVWMICGMGLRLVIQAFYFVVIARSLGRERIWRVHRRGCAGGNRISVWRYGQRRAADQKCFARSKIISERIGERRYLSTAASSSMLLTGVLSLSHFVLPATIPFTLVLMVSGSDLLGLTIITLCGQAFQSFDRLNFMATINVLVSASRLAPRYC